MKKIILIIIFIFFLQCRPAQEKVNIDLGVNYTYPWYSGYLEFTLGKYHYVFFDSQRDPTKDPLILWLNGGPGCSSLIGMVYENGPFVFLPNTTVFEINQHAWNKQANLLYIQSPGGVGFSLGSRKNYDDGTTTQDNLAALLAFFNKFPQLSKNDFYITGESYAGIYIPYLALKILEYNKLPSSRSKLINLKGIMIGNGCTDPRQCYDPTPQGNSLFQYQFLYRHGYYTQKDYDDVLAYCSLGFNQQPCKDLRAKLDKIFTNSKSSILNIYAPCYQNSNQNRKWKIRQSGRKYEVISQLDCDDNKGINYFFNKKLIFQQLHVDFIHFQQCSDHVADGYQSFANASYWIYPLLMKENLRLWVYSGNFDADVPITGTLVWLQRLKQQLKLPVIQPWRQWWTRGLHKHEDQVGGMVWQIKNITFVSINGAGHMAPKDKRKQAYVLIDCFINGKQMPYKQE